jgi:hypothetical protein
VACREPLVLLGPTDIPLLGSIISCNSFTTPVEGRTSTTGLMVYLPCAHQARSRTLEDGLTGRTARLIGISAAADAATLVLRGYVPLPDRAPTPVPAVALVVFGWA